jgi:hypothetical protein
MAPRLFRVHSGVILSSRRSLEFASGSMTAPLECFDKAPKLAQLELRISIEIVSCLSSPADIHLTL